MRIRSASLTLLLFLLPGTRLTQGKEPGPAEAVRAMVDAERKFYQTGQEKGTRAAFLAFLADDGIIFRPGPLNGRGVWQERPETGLDLIWEPAFASIARSGDFGYTTGPAKWKANKKDEQFLGHGHFVSIWKRQKEGSWKVALDLGIENPEPTAKPESLRMSVPADDSNGRIDLEARSKALKEEQRRFIEAAKSDATDAMMDAAAEEIRVYRDGSFPAVGKSNARTLIEAKKEKISFESLGGDMSRSGDLAYSYGKYSVIQSESSDSGHYFQIWQTNNAGLWKMVLDWRQPLPIEKS